MWIFIVIMVSFEPTYEELKPSSNGLTLLDLWGFEPTYEELKHRF